jgi:hypothetical protein
MVRVVGGLVEEPDDKDRDGPANLEIQIEEGDFQEPYRLVEDADEGVVHHDDPEDEKNDP